MGIFKRRGSKSRGVEEAKEGEEEGNASPPEAIPTRREQTRNSTRARRRRSKRRSRNNNNNGELNANGSSSSLNNNNGGSRSTTPINNTPGPPTSDMVPSLVVELETSPNTHGEQPARALRMLFALSEQQHNRTSMVSQQDGKLVQVLLEFLERCDRGSSEQYLSLLVLNNISIPAENKRMIALHCNGAQALTKLLCEDPSCHLLAIILVNLTFCEQDLRKELVNLQLLESLSYALQVASLKLEEYEAFSPLVLSSNDDNISPKELLQAFMVQQEQETQLSMEQHPLEDLDSNTGTKTQQQQSQEQIYPETARWCLSAIKNLTRPTSSQQACTTLMETGVVPLILKLITVGVVVTAPPNDGQEEQKEDILPRNGTRSVFNSPAKWDSNSMQDAALFVVMNLASSTSNVREVMREAHAVDILSRLANVWKQQQQASKDDTMQLQCFKARMALACLVGAEGHFGQGTTRTNRGSVAGSVHMMTQADLLELHPTEASLLLELLSNSMHGLAGSNYSAATFSPKWVLFALRCLLTNIPNQEYFSSNCGVVLNTLLIKALAQYSLGTTTETEEEEAPKRMTTTLDADAAAHAAFSLYLQSNYGFGNKPNRFFLPAIYDNGENRVAGTGSLACKILTSYIHSPDVTPAGRHAADQLLLRLHYLQFGGTLDDSDNTNNIPLECLQLDDSLVRMTDSMVVEKRTHGARPRPDIFDRAILRSRVPKKGGGSGKRGGTTNAPWGRNDGRGIATYPSALHATQALSFGSTKVRHLDAIDDVAIANNIANSANGEKTESYNYWWIWQDAKEEVQKHLDRQTSTDSKNSSASKKKMTTKQQLTKDNGGDTSIHAADGGREIRHDVVDEDGPFTIFGFTCGPCN
mmetsp:Transcript_27195/g.39825  ORF Transcript_27195/g.39825 Transcript_27195/m.39825 type:complete len:870 (-) Transcript_27195:277-2886(-)|eukprot:CAMPEP_0194033864 /NCGR_PEP_ID=MMETSP0009_2-20130614/6369_1 /TAXON_ID=210454 /ORGANISM="Grammatophora oceanica, Strain CCMP 410" /LENGTH=869 /DNA_ID=CAMNT_0038674595 /DNA_START=245 /DNA_END=2854 /DNA_ORIENTATION=-